MEGFVVPIIRDVVVGTVIVTELCVRVELEVGTDELLSCRDGVHEVTETAVLLVEEVLVSESIALSCCVACVEVLVVESGIVSLVVLCRVRDYIVVRDES